MTTPADYRAALEDLADRLQRAITSSNADRFYGEDRDALDRARAALAAEPEQGVPSDEELDRIYYNLSPVEIDRCWRDYARAVLTRYGAQPAPVPVSERLPGEEDCEPKMQRCWWLYPGFKESWQLSSRPQEGSTHWLPHWALPLPGAQP